jgi:hypothetical protein
MTNRVSGNSMTISAVKSIEGFPKIPCHIDFTFGVHLHTSSRIL